MYLNPSNVADHFKDQPRDSANGEAPGLTPDAKSQLWHDESAKEDREEKVSAI